MITRIDVEGVREAQAALRAVDKMLPRQLKVAGDRVVELFIGQARADARTRGERRALATLRPASQQRNAGFRIGTAAVPDWAGHVFGSTRYPQFRPWIAGGYALFPTLARMQPVITREYTREVEAVIDAAGLG